MANPLVAPIILAFMAIPSLSFADDYMPPVTHEATRAECGECHMAYPAGFLPAESWRRIMGTLDDHFGENAQLSEPIRAEIEAYLVSNASRRSRGILDGLTSNSPPPMRISELPWFVREHRGEISPQMMERAKTMSNCQSCHRGADRGIFEDD